MNRLADAPSPYLRQHAENPVDWWPWSDAAFAEARRRDVPVFLSVGYATCHWCHVMAHESFEDAPTARLLNDAFVCVKVDREERPDVDAVYMAVCQAVTGQGGWPLTVLLTPDQRPFFVGTYIPRTGRAGRAGLDEFVPQVAASWRTQRADIEAAADRLTGGLQTQFRNPDSAPPAAPDLGPETLGRAAARLMARYDAQNGGFGRSPKFPTPHTLVFLVREWTRTGDAALLDAATATLGAIRRGGIWDRLGGGIHRYATDARWRLPHFEKMLYDQALLVLACAEAFAATGDAAFRDTAEQTLAYVARDLTAPDGLFFSAEDADSLAPDGHMEEGAFYVWTEAELLDALGDADAALARAAFGTSPEGNAPDEATGALTGANVLFGEAPLANLAHTFETTEADLAARLGGIEARLLSVRETRPRPLLDDKILTDWNGLMVAALAVAARTFGVRDYAARATRAADALLATRRTPGGGLFHRAPQTDAGIAGLLDDTAFLAWGLTELYQATFDERYLAAALDLHGQTDARFGDAEAGGFYLTDQTAERLLVRPKPAYDGAIPSGAAVAALNGLRLSRLTGRTEWEDAARRALASTPEIAAFPDGHTVWMLALAFDVGPSQEVVVAGERGAADTEAMLAAVASVYAPNAVTLLRAPGTGAARLSEFVPFADTQTAIGGAATAYVCSDHACQEPTTDPKRAAALLAAAVG